MAVAERWDDEGAVMVTGKPTVPHVSYSQVSMFDDCSLKWWFRYVCKIKEPQTIQILAGDIFHKVMAENFRQKALTFCDLDLDELLDVYAQKFDAQILEKPISVPVGKTAGEFKDAGLAVLTHYIRTMSFPMMPKMVKFPGMPELEPAVELELLKRIPQTDVYFKAVLDLWEESGTVVDYKVIGRKWSKADAKKKSAQGYAYGFMLGGAVPFAFHACIRSAEKPLIANIPVPMSDGEVNGYIHHVWDVLVSMDAVRSRELEPRQSQGYCNEHMCSYCLGACKAWRFGMFDPADYKDSSDAPEGELIEEDE